MQIPSHEKLDKARGENSQLDTSEFAVNGDPVLPQFSGEGQSEEEDGEQAAELCRGQRGLCQSQHLNLFLCCRNHKSPDFKSFPTFTKQVRWMSVVRRGGDLHPAAVLACPHSVFH